MHLVFTKGAGKHDRMAVVRAGVPQAAIGCPKQGIIPHDMVHYAVEVTLHARGFIARVAAGEEAVFQMVPEAQSDGVERLVEVLQADGWSGWTGAPQDLLDLYHVTCQARGCPPLAIGIGDVEAVRGRVLELTARWASTPVGASLALPFPDA